MVAILWLDKNTKTWHDNMPFIMALLLLLMYN